MAIEGLQYQIMASALTGRAQNLHEEGVPGLSQGLIDHLIELRRSDARHIPDLAVVHMAHIVSDHTSFPHSERTAPWNYGGAFDALRDTYDRHHPRPWRQLSLTDPVIVSKGMRDRGPHQISWREDQRPPWNTLSHEPAHPYHFWTERPQEALLAVGGLQGYNLVNGVTQMLLRVDTDPRQLALDTVFGGLFLISDTPTDFLGHFERLADPQGQAGILEALERRMVASEETHQFQPGRSALLNELALRTGDLSLWGVLGTYADTLQLMRGNQPLPDHLKADFDWLADPVQFETIRDMYRTGRVRSFQADILGGLGLKDISEVLETRGLRISSLYLSSLPDEDTSSRLSTEGTNQVLGTIGQHLSTLPLHPEARLQWTAQSPLSILGELTDPLDPNCSYMEMPARLFRPGMDMIPLALRHNDYADGKNTFQEEAIPGQILPSRVRHVRHLTTTGRLETLHERRLEAHQRKHHYGH